MKGRVGKTTLTFLIATTMNRLLKSNYRILCVDLDPQANLTTHLIREELVYHLHEINISHLFAGRTKSLSQHMFESRYDSITILPSHIELALLEKTLQSHLTAPIILRKALETVKPSYDLVLIDCPPSLGILTSNGIIASDYVIVPITPDTMSLSGLGHTLTNLEQCKYFNPNTKLLSLVINMVDRRYASHNVFLEYTYKNPPAPILFQPLTRRAVIQRLLGRQKIFDEIDKADPDLKQELTDFMHKFAELVDLKAGEQT